jgi:hypothetical protein
MNMAVVPAVEVKDPISPSVVEHRLEAAVHEETRELLYCYNYIYYQFDVPSGKNWARSYLDEIKRVSLFLQEGMTVTDADAQRVMGYLTLRFRQIDMLSKKGYVSIWPKDSGAVEHRG